MMNTIKPAVVALIAASVVSAGATVQALASSNSGSDDRPNADSSQFMNDSGGRHRSADLRDDRRDIARRGEAERRDDDARRAEPGEDRSRHVEPGDDHGDDGLEVGDDHGNDALEPGDDHGDDGSHSDDDNGGRGGESDHGGDDGSGDDR